MMFKAPPEDTLEWSDAGVEGAARFVRKLWRVVHEHVSAGSREVGAIAAGALNDEQRAMRRTAHQTLAKVTDDLGRRRVFNTAIAAVMELMNTLGKFADRSPQGCAIVQETLEFVVQMLAPIVPHVCHVLWHELGHSDPLIDRAWPKVDPQVLLQETIEIVIQVNGKLRGRVTVPAGADRAQMEAAALADAQVQKWIEGRSIRKVIAVPAKLVNIVV